MLYYKSKRMSYLLYEILNYYTYFKRSCKNMDSNKKYLKIFKI